MRLYRWMRGRGEAAVELSQVFLPVCPGGEIGRRNGLKIASLQPVTPLVSLRFNVLGLIGVVPNGSMA
jgi:hypothetical protein